MTKQTFNIFIYISLPVGQISGNGQALAQNLTILQGEGGQLAEGQGGLQLGKLGAFQGLVHKVSTCKMNLL